MPNADATLVRLPDAVDFVSAAALGCRYMTAYHGLVDRAQLRPGEWVAVFAMGGLGLSTVQIAAALGARVVAITRSEEKLVEAKAEGAVATLNSSAPNVAETIKELTGGGADVSVDALGSGAIARTALLSLRKGGRHLQLGLTGQEDRGNVVLPLDAMVLDLTHSTAALGSILMLQAIPRAVFMLLGGVLADRFRPRLSMFVGVPALAKLALNAGSTGLGVLYGAAGLGAVIGSIAIGGLPVMRRQGLAGGLTLLATGLLLAATALASTLWLAALLLLLCRLAHAACANIFITFVRARAPAEARGRVMALCKLGVLGFAPLSLGVGGLIVVLAGAYALWERDFRQAQ